MSKVRTWIRGLGLAVLEALRDQTGAVTAEKSTQAARHEATATTKNRYDEYGGNLHIFKFNFTQGAAAGDATSTAELIQVPAGRWTLLGPLSFLQWDAFGAARTLDLGWAAYNESDGDAVAADADGIETAIDVAAAGQQNGLGDGIATGNGRCKEFDSRAGVQILATVAGGTIPAGTKISGYFVLAGGGN